MGLSKSKNFTGRAKKETNRNNASNSNADNLERIENDVEDPPISSSQILSPNKDTSDSKEKEELNDNNSTVIPDVKSDVISKVMPEVIPETTEGKTDISTNNVNKEKMPQDFIETFNSNESNSHLPDASSQSPPRSLNLICSSPKDSQQQQDSLPLPNPHNDVKESPNENDCLAQNVNTNNSSLSGGSKDIKPLLKYTAPLEAPLVSGGYLTVSVYSQRSDGSRAAAGGAAVNCCPKVSTTKKGNNCVSTVYEFDASCEKLINEKIADKDLENKAKGKSAPCATISNANKKRKVCIDKKDIEEIVSKACKKK